LVSGIILIPAALGLRWLLVPAAMTRREISPGVFLEVHRFDQPGTAEGVAMVAEIHWDHPEVEIIIRPFDEDLLPDDKHYRLTVASWEVLRQDFLLLMNGTLHDPSKWCDNYPGASVRPNESVVVDGKWSHIHEHSYMLWWDRDGNAYFEHTKPPPAECRENAWMGVGLQGVSVLEGNVREEALGDAKTVMDSQSFIGIDTERKILWLAAFEKATAGHAARFMAALGARFAGRLDSGDSTTLIVGPDSRAIRAFTGIRHSRFLGNYIAVRRSSE
jgi:hypothetical protein